MARRRRCPPAAVLLATAAAVALLSARVPLASADTYGYCEDIKYNYGESLLLF